MTEHDDCGPDCGHDHGPETEAQQQEQLEKHFEEVSGHLQVLYANLELPGFMDQDDPLFGIFLDQPEESEMREVILRHVWSEHFDVSARISMVTRLDQFLQTSPGEKPRRAADTVRDALLEPYSYVDTDWIQFQVSTERFFSGLQDYFGYWRETAPDEALQAHTVDLEQPDPECSAAVEALSVAGRNGVQATLEYLNREYVPILSDFQALQEKGVEPLLRAIAVLAAVPSPGSATVLGDQLAIINHPDVEKALFEALTRMPLEASRVAADFIRFEPLLPATRFVLHELLHKLKSDEADRLIGDEFLLSGFEEDQRMGEDDLEDLAEMWAESAGARSALVALHVLTQEEIPEGARNKIQSVIDNAADTELVAWAKKRVEEDLPVVFYTEDDAGTWAEKLAQRWECESTDSRVSEVLENTPAVPLFLHSPAATDPPPGPKEEFLEKICRHEVASEAERFIEQSAEEIPLDQVQAFLAQHWWLRPRAESAWKPPLLAMLKERSESLPEHAELTRLKLEPMVHAHCAAAVRAIGQGEDVRMVDAHLMIASEMLPEADAYLAYARKLREAVSRQQQSPKIWTPGQQDAGPKKVGRNDPCPCGSGKKYKKCCLGR